MRKGYSMIKKLAALGVALSLTVSVVPSGAFSETVKAGEMPGSIVEAYEDGNGYFCTNHDGDTENEALVEAYAFSGDASYDGYDEQPCDFDTPAVDPALSYSEVRSMLIYDGNRDVRGTITNEDYSVPASYPYSYTEKDELRNYLKSELTPVRDQGAEGSCWAHSAISLIENYILRNGKQDLNGTTAIDSNGIVPGINYSELHLAYFYYHNGKNPIITNQNDTLTFTGQSFIDFGGNLRNAAQSLMTWRGVVDEILVPYESKSLLTSSTQMQAKTGIQDGFTYDDDVAHLTNAYRINVKENAAQVKQAIKENGAVGVSIYANKSFYDSEHNAYYNYLNSGTTNHAVNIVGWDDDFPAEFFTAQSTKPSGNGAWLIRNSWVDTLKNPNEELLKYQAYFWLSYEDVSLSDTAFVFEADISPYDNNYYYTDQIHNTASISSDKVANVFTVNGTAGASQERIDAIAFETYASDFEYTVSIRKTDGSGKPSESAGDIYTSQSGRIYYPGIYTIELNNPVTLNKGEKFAVVIETSVDKCICEEYYIEKDAYLVKVYLNEGESFSYRNGAWQDRNLSSGSEYYGKEGNICIQAFTTDLGTDGNRKVKGLTVTGRTETSVTLKWDALEGATSYCIYRTAGENYAYLDSFTKIKSGETSTTYTDTTIAKNSHCYYYVVPVIGAEKKAQASRTLAVEPVPSDDTTKKATITETKGSVGGRKCLYGVDGSASASGYSISYRKKGESEWTVEDTEMTNFTSLGMSWVFYIDELPVGDYEFSVKPYYTNMYGERRYGGEANGSFIVKFPAPQNISSYYNSIDKKLTITWDPVEGATGYMIFTPNSSNPNTYYTLGTTSDGKCSFVTDFVYSSSSSVKNYIQENGTYTFYIYVYDPDRKTSDGKTDYSWNYALEGKLEVTVTAPDVKKGDVNGDSIIDAKDVTALRRFLAGGWNVTIADVNADTNGDGTIDAKDVTLLRRYLAGGWGVELG